MRMIFITTLLLSTTFSNLIFGEIHSNSFCEEEAKKAQHTPFFNRKERKNFHPTKKKYTDKILTFTFFGNNEESSPPATGTFTAMVTLPNNKVHRIRVPFDGSASIKIAAPSKVGLYGIGIYANPGFSGVNNTQTVTVTSDEEINLLFHFNSLRTPGLQQTTIYINEP